MSSDLFNKTSKRELKALEVGDSFIVVEGRIFYPSKTACKPACSACDFAKDFGSMDCSCICDLLKVADEHCLKEVYSSVRIFLNS